MRDTDPDYIIHNGDMLDFPSLSTKFLRTHTQPNDVINDISVAKGIFRKEHKVAPNAEIILLPGNHEERLNIYVEEKAPAMADFLDGVLELQALIGDEASVVGQYSAGTAEWERDGLLVTHGEASGLNAGKRNIETYGSIVYGHTHRHTALIFSNREGDHGSWSGGTLSNVRGSNQPPSAHKHGYRNVQQGIITVYFDSRGFTVYPTLIHEWGFHGPDGKLYK
jgi:predicted phosphodiesterase